MIRVNLARNRVQQTTSVSATSAATAFAGIGKVSENAREILVKFAFMGLFTAGLMIYESQHLRELNTERARLTNMVNQEQAEATAKNGEVEKVKDIEAQARELEDKLKVMKLLSRLRLREVKTLDFMQSSIPEKVWLKSIVYDSEKGHLESGHFQISGFSVATDDLTEFVKRLDDSAFLMNVIVVKNLEMPTVKGSSSIRDFLFTAEVENKN